jgi:hypothetical protein
MTKMYRPLSHRLTIKDSSIHGLGLFATEDITANTLLGTSHYFLDDGGLLRTTLGGYYNHSDDPNAYTSIVNPGLKEHGMRFVELRTLRKIDKGEEITAIYQLDPLKKGT